MDTLVFAKKKLASFWGGYLSKLTEAGGLVRKSGKQIAKA